MIKRPQLIMNIIFVGTILLVLLAGLVRTLFFPEEVNTYENRYAEKVAPLTAGSWLDSSFQDSVDAALSDQVWFSQSAKKLYNQVSSYSLKAAVSPILSATDPRYINFRGLRLFEDHITYYTYDLASKTQELDDKVDNYNHTFAAFPDLDFYIYYIEKDTDINFETGEKLLAYEYLQDRLDLPASHMARLEIDSFEDFSARFYKTDHHWNYVGSYQGYNEVLSLLGVTDEPLVPQETVTLALQFSGSKASGVGVEGFSEDFTAYRFDFPDMDIQISGQPADDYGSQSYYLSGQGSSVSYGSFYGGDAAEIIFSTGQEDRENILVIGESYDNAILKLLASHFHNTYSIDLRYYQTVMGTDFRFSDYVKEHDITKVLLIGNVDYFIMSEFCLEG